MSTINPSAVGQAQSHFGSFSANNCHFRTSSAALQARSSHFRQPLNDNQLQPDRTRPRQGDPTCLAYLAQIVTAMVDTSSYSDNDGQVDRLEAVYMSNDDRLLPDGRDKIESHAWLFLDAVFEYHQRAGPLDRSTSRKTVDGIRSGEGSFKQHIDDLCVLLCEWKSVCLRAWDAPEKIRAVIDDIAYTATTTLEGKKSNDRRAIKGGATRDARRATRQPFPAQVATASPPTTQMLHQAQIAAAQPLTVPVSLHAQLPDAVAATPVDNKGQAPSLTAAAASKSRKRRSSASTFSEPVENPVTGNLLPQRAPSIEDTDEPPPAKKQKSTHVSSGFDALEFDEDEYDFSLGFGCPLTAFAQPGLSDLADPAPGFFDSLEMSPPPSFCASIASDPIQFDSPSPSSYLNLVRLEMPGYGDNNDDFHTHDSFCAGFRAGKKTSARDKTDFDITANHYHRTFVRGFTAGRKRVLEDDLAWSNAFHDDI